MPDSTIDAIQVALGIDRNRLRSDLAQVKQDFDRAVPKDRNVRVNVSLHVAQQDVNKMYAGLRQQVQRQNQAGGPEAFRITPQLRVDRRGLTEFRRDTDRQLRQAAMGGAPIHVPIKPTFNTREFQAEIISKLGTIEVPIRGRWEGWAPGGGPSGAGGGGAPVGPHRPHGPVGGAPAAVARPASPVARRGAEVASADVYTTPPPPPRAPTPTQQRQTERRARMAGQPVGPAYGPPAPFTPYGGGARTRGARVTPGYVEPAGGRVTMGNVRGGGQIDELQGAEREAYMRQQRALGRTDFSPNLAPEAAGRISGRPTSHRQVEFFAQLHRARAARARGETPGDLRAREALRTGFHSFDPNLALAFDRLADPDSPFDYPAFQSAGEASLAAYRGNQPQTKKEKRARRIAMGFAKGDVSDIDPTILAVDSALKAAKQFSATQMNPLAVVQKGDTSRRGRGGKVGQIGGRGAGRLASETVEPSAIEEIMRRRRAGGRGNGWKSLAGEFSGAEISAARARLAAYAPVAPVTDITPGQAYGGGAEMYLAGRLGEEGPTEAPSVVGGQGLSRGTGSSRERGMLDPRFITGEGSTSNARYSMARPSAREMDVVARWRRRQAARQFFGPPIPGMPRFAEGGKFTNSYMQALYTRGIGSSFGAPEGHENVARANSYEWQKARRSTISSMPFCAHCGISRAEARSRGIRMTADKIVPQSQGGDPWDPKNRQTLCDRCNSRKSGFDLEPDTRWGRARPNISKHASLSEEGEFLPHGRFFGMTSLAQIRGAMRNRADGGGVKWGGLASSRGGIRSATMVGERGPEILVEGHNGQQEVIPSHKVAAWMDRRQEGGIRTIQTPSGPRYQGPGGRFISAAQAATAMGGGAGEQRVFVVNWPKFLSDANQFARGMNMATAAPAIGTARAGTRTQAAGPPSPMGTGGGAGAPADIGGGRLGANPAAAAEARRAARRNPDVQGFEERIGTVRAGIAGSLQEAPVRALSVAIGQIAQQMIGGRGGILQRARAAQSLAGEAQEETSELRRLQQRREEFRIQERDIAAGTSGLTATQIRKAEATRANVVPQLDVQIGKAAEAAEAATAAAETAERGVLTRPQQFRAQAVGLGGIVGGTAIFSTAIAGFNLAMEAAAHALGPVVDETLGWAIALDRTAGTMRDSIQQLRSVTGTETARAQFAVSAGMGGPSAAQLLGPVSARAEAQAAARIQSLATDATRAAIGGGLRGGANQALFTGTGGVMGGSFLAEQLGGQPGLLEEVVKQITAPTGLGAFRNQEDINELDLRGFIEAQGKGTEIQDAVVTDINEALKRTATAAGDTADAFEIVPRATDEMKKAMITSADQISRAAGDRARDLARAGFAFTGPRQRPLAGREFQTAAAELGRGRLIPDVEQTLRLGQQQRRQRALESGMRAEFGRREDLPGAFALQRLAAPPMRFGATFSSVGANAATLSNISRYEKMAADSTSNLEDYQKRGTASLETIVARIDNPRVGFNGVPTPGAGQGGPALTAFRGITGRIGTLGGQINQIQTGIAERQVTAQVHQYNNEIRITTRALHDAEDLWAGINGNVSDSLGGLQAQNILLDRQNQMLSRRAQRLSFRSEDVGFRQQELQMRAQQMQFEMAQRQINFQKAVAGFTAPGLTPEERAARINEAKVEADFAQRQLNIQIQIAKMAREQLQIAKQQAGVQREMFANQMAQQDNAFQIQRIEASRAVEDLRAQLELLQEGRQLTIDTAAAEETIERLRGEVNVLMEEAQSYVQQGIEVRSQIIADMAELMATTGKGFSELVGQVAGAWSDAFQAYYDNFYTPLIKSIQYFSGQTNQYGTYGTAVPPDERRQTGGISTVTSPTTFLAGEAGSEHVIVLRNATKGTLVGGGGGVAGGVNITIVVQGTKDMDEEKLAAAVERRLSTKLAMVAGRPAA